MTAVNWNAALPIVFEGLILLFFFIWTKRNPKDRLAVGIALTVFGALELLIVIMVYVSSFILRTNQVFKSDYYGETTFLLLFLVLAIATVAYGIWNLDTKNKRHKHLTLRSETVSAITEYIKS